MADHEHKESPQGGGISASDDINIAQVAMIGTFLALALFVMIVLLQAWFYHADESERVAKTARQDDPATPFGAMIQEHTKILTTGDMPDGKGGVHHGVPIQTAMQMVVENPKLLSQPLGGK